MGGWGDVAPPKEKEKKKKKEKQKEKKKKEKEKRKKKEGNYDRIASNSEIIHPEIGRFMFNTVVFDVGEILPKAINSIKFLGKIKLVSKFGQITTYKVLFFSNFSSPVRGIEK